MEYFWVCAMIVTTSAELPNLAEETVLKRASYSTSANTSAANILLHTLYTFHASTLLPEVMRVWVSRRLVAF